MSKSKQIKARLEDAGIRYWAGDNISEVLQKGDKEELLQYGYEGFMKACEKYDDTRGTKISTYSYYWINAYFNRFSKYVPSCFLTILLAFDEVSKSS